MIFFYQSYAKYFQWDGFKKLFRDKGLWLVHRILDFTGRRLRWEHYWNPFKAATNECILRTPVLSRLGESETIFTSYLILIFAASLWGREGGRFWHFFFFSQIIKFPGKYFPESRKGLKCESILGSWLSETRAGCESILSGSDFLLAHLVWQLLRVFLHRDDRLSTDL